MRVGFAKNPRALKLGVIERIIWAWILTIPAAGGVAYGLFKLIGVVGST
jgi:PiT family inorganic phosphate transporter